MDEVDATEGLTNTSVQAPVAQRKSTCLLNRGSRYRNSLGVRFGLLSDFPDGNGTESIVIKNLCASIGYSV